MQTIDNGYLLPETGDNGAEFFPALEFNIQRVGDHNHDGSNSERIASSAVVGDSASILQANFVVSGAEFRQSLTVPNAGLYNQVGLEIRDPATGDRVHLKTERTSPTQFFVYTSFPQDYEVVYV